MKHLLQTLTVSYYDQTECATEVWIVKAYNNIWLYAIVNGTFTDKDITI